MNLKLYCKKHIDALLKVSDSNSDQRICHKLEVCDEDGCLRIYYDKEAEAEEGGMG